jgi:hypothetical protein
VRFAGDQKTALSGDSLYLVSVDAKDRSHLSISVQFIKFLKKAYVLRKNDLYSRNFYKTHLIVNNGSFGTVFSVQSKETEECYAARHVKSKSVRGNLMVSNNCKRF